MSSPSKVHPNQAAIPERHWLGVGLNGRVGATPAGNAENGGGVMLAPMLSGFSMEHRPNETPDKK
jgi:hypothetical protein